MQVTLRIKNKRSHADRKEVQQGLPGVVFLPMGEMKHGKQFKSKMLNNQELFNYNEISRSEARSKVGEELENPEIKRSEVRSMTPVAGENGDALLKGFFEGPRGAEMTFARDLFELVGKNEPDAVSRMQTIIAQFPEDWPSDLHDGREGINKNKRTVKIILKKPLAYTDRQGHLQTFDEIHITGILFTRKILAQKTRHYDYMPSEDTGKLLVDLKRQLADFERGKLPEELPELKGSPANQAKFRQELEQLIDILSRGGRLPDQLMAQDGNKLKDVEFDREGQPVFHEGGFPLLGGHGEETAKRKFENARYVLPEYGLRGPLVFGYGTYSTEGFEVDSKRLGIFISLKKKNELPRLSQYMEGLHSQMFQAAFQSAEKEIAGLRGTAREMKLEKMKDTAYPFRKAFPKEEYTRILRSYGRALRRVVGDNLEDKSRMLIPYKYPHMGNLAIDFTRPLPGGGFEPVWYDLGGWKSGKEMTPEQAFSFVYYTLAYGFRDIVHVLNVEGSDFNIIHRLKLLDPLQLFLEGFFYDRLEDPEFRKWKIHEPGFYTQVTDTFRGHLKDPSLPPPYLRKDMPYVQLLRKMMGMNQDEDVMKEKIREVVAKWINGPEVIRPGKISAGEAIRAVVKELLKLEGAFQPADINKAFQSARLSFKTSGKAVEVASDLNHAFVRSEVRTGDTAELFSGEKWNSDGFFAGQSSMKLNTWTGSLTQQREQRKSYWPVVDSRVAGHSFLFSPLFSGLPEGATKKAVTYNTTTTNPAPILKKKEAVGEDQKERSPAPKVISPSLKREPASKERLEDVAMSPKVPKVLMIRNDPRSEARIKSEPDSIRDFYETALKIQSSPVLELGNYALIVYRGVYEGLEKYDRLLQEFDRETGSEFAKAFAGSMQQFKRQLIENVPAEDAGRSFQPGEEDAAKAAIQKLSEGILNFEKTFKDASIFTNALTHIQQNEEKLKSPEVQVLFNNISQIRRHIWRLLEHFSAIANANNPKPFGIINQELDLNKLIHKVIEKERGRSPLHFRISDVIFKSGEIPKGAFDEARLENALSELIRNAVFSTIRRLDKSQYASYREISTVVIETAFIPETQSFKITISDNGIGIKPEDMPFIEYYGYSKSDYQKDVFFGGRGIGFPTAALTVKEHEGTLHVQSDPESGTTVMLHLPVTMSLEKRSEARAVSPKVEDSNLWTIERTDLNGKGDEALEEKIMKLSEQYDAELEPESLKFANIVSSLHGGEENTVFTAHDNKSGEIIGIRTLGTKAFQAIANLESDPELFTLNQEGEGSTTGDVMVIPSWQDKGIGTALFREALDYLKMNPRPGIRFHFATIHRTNQASFKAMHKAALSLGLPVYLYLKQNEKLYFLIDLFPGKEDSPAVSRILTTSTVQLSKDPNEAWNSLSRSEVRSVLSLSLEQRKILDQLAFAAEKKAAGDERTLNGFLTADGIASLLSKISGKPDLQIIFPETAPGQIALWVQKLVKGESLEEKPADQKEFWNKKGAEMWDELSGPARAMLYSAAFHFNWEEPEGFKDWHPTAPAAVIHGMALAILEKMEAGVLPQSLLADIDALESLAQKFNLGTPALIFNQSLSALFPDYENAPENFNGPIRRDEMGEVNFSMEKYVSLSSQIHRLPGMLSIRATALSLMTLGNHFFSGTPPYDQWDIRAIVPDLKFAAETISKQSLPGDQRQMMKRSLTRFVVSLLAHGSIHDLEKIPAFSEFVRFFYDHRDLLIQWTEEQKREDAETGISQISFSYEFLAYLSAKWTKYQSAAQIKDSLEDFLVDPAAFKRHRGFLEKLPVRPDAVEDEGIMGALFETDFQVSFNPDFERYYKTALSKLRALKPRSEARSQKEAEFGKFLKELERYEKEAIEERAEEPSSFAQGAVLRLLRETAELKQAGLGIDAATVSQIEAGDKAISSKALEIIVPLLQKTFDQRFGTGKVQIRKILTRVFRIDLAGPKASGPSPEEKDRKFLTEMEQLANDASPGLLISGLRTHKKMPRKNFDIPQSTLSKIEKRPLSVSIETYDEVLPLIIQPLRKAYEKEAIINPDKIEELIRAAYQGFLAKHRDYLSVSKKGLSGRQFKNRSEVRQVAIEDLAPGLVEMVINGRRATLEEAERVVVYVEYEGFEALREALKEAWRGRAREILRQPRKGAASLNTPQDDRDGAISGKVWNDEIGMLMDSLAPAPSEDGKIPEVGGTIALVLPADVGDSVIGNFVRALSAANVKNLFVVGRGKAVDMLVQAVKEHKIHSSPVKRIAEIKNEDYPVPTGIFGANAEAVKAVQTILPFWANMEGVSENNRVLVGDYVQVLYIAALSHAANILRTQPHLRGEALKKEIIAKLKRFQNFENILTPSGNGFVISGIIAETLLKARSEARFQQAA